MTDNNIKVGLTSWNEKNQTGPREPREELPRIPFLRLSDGNNVVRCITDPYAYFHIKYKGPNSRGKFGDRVNTAWPTFEDCPAYLNREALTGSKGNPKKRYFVPVIDRSDQSVKIFDMSLLVYEQLEGIVEDIKDATKEEHNPTQFDVNVRYNSNSPTPSGYYNVMARPVTSLSEADVELINKIDGGMETIEKVLDRQSASPTPERVQRRLEKLGWDPNTVAESESKDKDEETKSGDLNEPEEEDYSFDEETDEPTAAAAAN
jgi:hypothetical protein